MMSKQQNGIGCALWCWGISLVGGVLVAALLMVLGGWSFLQAVFGGVVCFVIAGALLSWILCRPLPALQSAGGAAAGGHTTGGHAAGGDATGSHAAGGSTSAGGAPAAAEAQASEGNAGAATADTSAAAAGSTGAGASVGAAAAGAGTVTASTPLAGEAELAERKGSWRYGEDGGSDVGSGGSDGSGAAGTGADDGAASEAGAATTTADYDKDGVLEGENEGTKPEMLSGPREGGADNLKEIKGIGPKLEDLVNSMGVYHFDQIANWTADEVAWVNANLAGFKGRVTRDNWIDQAKILAAGGETEFSKRVEKGGVYDE